MVIYARVWKAFENEVAVLIAKNTQAVAEVRYATEGLERSS